MIEGDAVDTGIRVTITPEPTDEEIAAVAAVVTALAASAGQEDTPALVQPQERWSMAGRREALRGPLWPDDRASGA